MEWVYHIYVVKVDRCRLISHIDGVLERNIPDREGLKLSVACLNSTLVIVIKL